MSHHNELPKWIGIGAYEPMTERSIHMNDLALGYKMADIVLTAEAGAKALLAQGIDVGLYMHNWEDAAWIAEQNLQEACADEAAEFEERRRLGLL